MLWNAGNFSRVGIGKMIKIREGVDQVEMNQLGDIL